MLDRTDRSLVGVWWWTVDRGLLLSTVMLMVMGILLLMAAGHCCRRSDQTAIPAFYDAPNHLHHSLSGADADRIDAGATPHSCP